MGDAARKIYDLALALTPEEREALIDALARVGPSAARGEPPLVERIRDLLDDGRVREAGELAGANRGEAGPYARVLEPPARVRSAPPGRPDFVENMSWVGSHRSEYEGRWVALRDGSLVAVADRLAALQVELRERNETEVLVVRVDP